MAGGSFPIAPSAASRPIAQVRLNSTQFVPIKSVTVEKSAYSVADTATCSTFAAGAPVDYGKLSQTAVPCSYEVFLTSGVLNPPGTPDDDSRTLHSQGQRLLYGLLDQITTTYDDDTIDLTARGVLSLLIDQRMTARLPMNQTVNQVIAGIITQFKLQAQVTPTTVLAGTVLDDDFVSMARNMRAMDVIVGLADYLGWDVRVQGTTVVVGPPAPRGTVPELSFVWGRNAGEKLNVVHDALHTRDIKVIVKSYLPRPKSRVSALAQLGESSVAQILGLPTQTPPSAPSQPAPSGAQSGFTSVGADYQTETYVFHIPGHDADWCNKTAAAIRDDLTRREFIATLEFTPDPDQIAMLVPAGCEFTVYLSGCSQPSHNGLYHPKQVTWSWELGQGQGDTTGLTCRIVMVNHELPAPVSGAVGGAAF